MDERETVAATSGGRTATFALDFASGRWTSGTDFEEGAFPFIGELRGKRYEIYSDGSFDEEERNQ
jgi:hypothetical protein